MGPRGTTTIRVHRDLHEVATDWEMLADRCKASPFVRPGWVAAWYSAFAAGREELWTAWCEDELVGILPLARRAGVLRSPANYHTPQFELLAAGGEVAGTLLDAALASSARRLDLRFLQQCDARTVRAVAARAPALLVERSLGPAPYVALDGDWRAYEASLGRNLRKSLRRGWRRLAEHGSVTVDTVREPERLERHLPEFFTVEGAGWKGRRGTAIASRPATRHFYRTVARWAAVRGCLRLSLLRVDGRAVAGDFGIDSQGVNYSLKCGYDERFARYSPGHLLLMAVLRSLCEEGLRGMDMLEGSESYKQRWTPHAVERRRMQLFPRTPSGVVEWAAWRYGRPLVKRVTALRRLLAG